MDQAFVYRIDHQGHPSTPSPPRVPVFAIDRLPMKGIHRRDVFTEVQSDQSFRRLAPSNRLAEILEFAGLVNPWITAQHQQSEFGDDLFNSTQVGIESGSIFIFRVHKEAPAAFSTIDRHSPSAPESPPREHLRASAGTMNNGWHEVSRTVARTSASAMLPVAAQLGYLSVDLAIIT
jgi:hypothetical protein